MVAGINFLTTISSLQMFSFTSCPSLSSLTLLRFNSILYFFGLFCCHLLIFLFFSVSSKQSIDLYYCDTEWFALEMNRDHPVIFEIAPNYCISGSFVDYEGYSISSKGFLPTVVHIMIIWIKFAHSSPF